MTEGEGVDDDKTTGDEDGMTDGEGVEDVGTTGAVVPDSLGEVTEGVTEGTTTGVLLFTGGLDAGGLHLLDGAGTQSKFIPTTPIGTLGPDGELG